jgi:hypothetical protein
MNFGESCFFMVFEIQGISLLLNFLLFRVTYNKNEIVVYPKNIFESPRLDIVLQYF